MVRVLEERRRIFAVFSQVTLSRGVKPRRFNGGKPRITAMTQEPSYSTGRMAVIYGWTNERLSAYSARMILIVENLSHVVNGHAITPQALRVEAIGIYHSVDSFERVPARLTSRCQSVSLGRALREFTSLFKAVARWAFLLANKWFRRYFGLSGPLPTAIVTAGAAPSCDAESIPRVRIKIAKLLRNVASRASFHRAILA